MTAPAGGIEPQRQQITHRLLAMLAALFAGMGAWRDADAERFTAQAAPLVRGAQQALAGMVATYLAQRASEATGNLVTAPAIPGLRDLRGPETREVYLRPFKAVWAALADGKTLPQAVQQGQSRLAELADGDMQLTYAYAHRDGMQRLPEDAQPSGWRRVLQGSSSCALCVLASTHRYSIGDLNPIHQHCDCGIEPIFGRDTARAADDATLQRVHDAVAELSGASSASGRGVDYRQIQITQTHGELGPMLARPGDHFTGPGEIPSS